MNATIITLGALLAIAAYLAGRSCIITERLRKRNKKNEGTIYALRCDRERIEKERSSLAVTLLELQNPFIEHKRTFSVVEVCEGCSTVMMTVEVHNRTTGETRDVTIPIKYSTDEDDPEFARSEAEEFKAKCEEV